jgi:two-component system cell cycle sensor histidine kinase/response regulator CckA
MRKRHLDKQICRILLIEDNPGDVRLIREMLAEASDTIDLVNVETLKKAFRYLEKNTTDAILLDLGLPDSQGLNTFKKIYTQTPNIPIIVLTEYKDEELAVQMVNEGAQDYLMKG